MVEKPERVPTLLETGWAWWMDDEALFPLWLQLQDPYLEGADAPPHAALPGLGMDLKAIFRRFGTFLGLTKPVGN